MINENNSEDLIENSAQSFEPSGSQRFMYQEYWVDFLGGLLPGALFSVIGFYILAPSFVLFLNAYEVDNPTGIFSLFSKVLQSTKDTPNMIWIGFSIILVSVSYVLGHIFYRQDPKHPNEKSLARLAKRHAERIEKSECDPEEMKNEFGCSSTKECEFPYHYFKQYLNHRGLHHLEHLAVWCNQYEHRTKNYINILKIRIRFHYPNHCSTIIRNEAHIRLATSVWYVGKVVIKTSILAMLLVVSAILIKNFGNVATTITAVPTSNLIIALFTLISGGYLGYYMQGHVEDFLHYQRQREIVHVLEIAWTAFSDRPDLLNPPFPTNSSHKAETQNIAGNAHDS